MSKKQVKEEAQKQTADEAEENLRGDEMSKKTKVEEAQNQSKKRGAEMMSKNAREARADFLKANNGPGEVLAGVDKRIKNLTAIHGAARDHYIVIKEGFKPGEDRQSIETNLYAMSRDIKKLQAARDELAVLL